MKNQSGFTLTEVLIAMGLSSIVFLGVQSAVTSFYSQVNQQKQTLKHADLVQSVMAQVMGDISLLQANFDTSDTTFGDTLNLDELPMAWDRDLYVLVKDCKKCPGRAGYKIMPMQQMKGLYRVTIRISHSVLMPNNGYRDYKMVIGNP